MGSKRRRNAPRQGPGNQGGMQAETVREPLPEARPGGFRGASGVAEPVGRTAPDDGVPAAFRRRRESLFLPQFGDDMDVVSIQAKDSTDPAADPRVSPKTLARALEAEQPGLTAKLAAGLSKDEMSAFAPAIARAIQAAEAGPADLKRLLPAGGPELVITDDIDSVPEGDGPEMVIEDLDADDPDAGRLLIGSREEVKAWHRQTREADRRAMKLLPSGTVKTARVLSEDGARRVMLREHWTPDEVISLHAWLTYHYRKPSDHIADYCAYIIRDTIAVDASASAMFYPINTRRAVDLDEGRQLAHLIARGLGDARTFQVTAPMCQKMYETWRGQPAPVLALDQGELPVPAGFAWLDRPWLAEVDTGYWTPIRAVSWECTTEMFRADPDRAWLADPYPGACVRFVLWLMTADDVAFGRWEGEEKRADKVVTQLGRIVPQHVSLIPFQTPLRLAGNPVTGGGKALLGLLRTLWHYLGELLPKSRPIRATAPVIRRRARESLKYQGEIRVIRLREYDYIGDVDAHFPRKIDWKWRQWVHEFHRHIDPYEDYDEDARKHRRHKAVPARRYGLVPDDDHDVCGVCLANGQTVRITLVHQHPRGPSDLPFRKPAPERELYLLAR